MTVQIEAAIPDQSSKIASRRNGFLANRLSYTIVSTIPTRPTMVVTRTAGLRHWYLLPPQLKPMRNDVELATMNADPIQSMEETLSPIVTFSGAALPRDADPF